MKRALIVGAGASGFLHALALRAAGVRIAAVHDPDRERARWLADLSGGEPMDWLDAEADVDVVAICSPPHVHVDQAVALSRPERLVFVEKPIAVTAPELRRLEALPNVVPILQWRAGLGGRQLRAAFAEGAFGPQAEIRCDLRLWRDASYFSARADWRCGAMLSIGIHAIDLVVWMVDRPIVRAVRTEAAGRDGLDAMTRGYLELEFEGGARAHVRITLDAAGRNEFFLAVRGERASAELLAGEGDPTASPVKWRGFQPRATILGATGSPLLVPYLREALAGDAPTVADVVLAHALAVLPREALRD